MTKIGPLVETGPPVYCKVCEAGFPDQARLLSHTLTCTVRIERGPFQQFQNAWIGGAESRTGDEAVVSEVLTGKLPTPLTQDPSQLTQEPTEQSKKSKCSYCSREFKNEKFDGEGRVLVYRKPCLILSNVEHSFVDVANYDVV